MKFREEPAGGTTLTLVLSVLNAGPAHGYEIVRRINDLSGGVIEWQEGTIYPALHALEDRKWIQGKWVEPSSGQLRRVYSLTELGKQALFSEAREWSAYSKAVESVLEASCA